MSQPHAVGTDRASFRIADPTGREICIPADRVEDVAYFTADRLHDIPQYYDANGYVVVRAVIPADLCDAARQAFATEVKPYNGFIYRQTTSYPERHQWTEAGFMINPILNVQSLDPNSLGRFQEAGLKVLTHKNIQAVATAILGEAPKLVQSMYFDGNPATWPHQDTYYLDAEEIGRMTAAWIAVEDIAPGAGRFFVYPESDKIDLHKTGKNFNYAFQHARYKEMVKRIIVDHGLQCRAPALGKGDVLFWAAKTIHGSLRTTQPEFSRSSFTAHYIPDSSRFLQFQAKIKGMNLATVNGMRVNRAKDLSNPGNRRILWVETHFPRTFRFAKRVAIRLLTR